MSQPLTQGALRSGEKTKTSINTMLWEIHCQRRMHLIAMRPRMEVAEVEEHSKSYAEAASEKLN